MYEHFCLYIYRHNGDEPISGLIDCLGQASIERSFQIGVLIQIF